MKISLREAVIAANNTAGADIINLNSGTYSLTASGANDDLHGDLDVRDDLQILGAGAGTTIIDGGGQGVLDDRIFEFHGSSVDATLDGVTIQGGFINYSHGAGFRNNSSNVTLNDVAISNNIVQTLNATNNDRFGGGFYNTGSAADVIGTNVTISNNVAERLGSGRNAFGGGFWNQSGRVTLTDSVINNNETKISGAATAGGQGVGGGFWNTSNGTTTLNDSHVHNNIAREGGGFHSTSVGTETYLNGVILEDNEAVVHGGGFRSNFGTITTIQHSATQDGVIRGNKTTSGGHGGGFYNQGTTTIIGTAANRFEITGNEARVANRVGGGFYAGLEGTVNLDYVDITNNSANEGGGFYQDTGGSQVIGTNVLIDGNTARTRGGGFRNATPEALVQLTDSTISNNEATEEHGGGFYNNGTVTLSNTDISSNHTIDLSNPNRRDGYGGGFYNGGGIVNLNNGSDVLNNDAWGHGGGFYNSGGEVNADDIVIDGNFTIYFNNPRHGGGFWNGGDGDVNLTDTVISDNYTGPDSGGTRTRGIGGGFWNTDGSTVNIDGDSQIIRNRAEDGGGFYNTSSGGTVNITGTAANPIEIGGSGADANTARVRGGGFRSTGNTYTNLDHVNVSWNTTDVQRGGGFYADGATIVGNNVSIANNSTGTDGRSGDEQGGGFWVDGNGTTTLTDSEVVDNETLVHGGGFYVNNGTVNLIRTDVERNFAQNSGGGFFNENSGIVNATDSSISQNIARDHGGGFWAEDDSQVTTSRTHIDGNLAGYESDGVTQRESGAIGADLRGGGFWASGRSQVSLVDSTLSDNEAARHGGGGNMENESRLTLTGSTVSGNVADNHGGGFRIASSARFDATNSTISDNYAGFSRAENGNTIVASTTNAVGGGFWSQSGGNVVNLNHSTIADNKASRGGIDAGAGYYRSSGTITIENSILFGNIADFDELPANQDASDIRGNGILVGANVIGVQGNGTLSGNTAGRVNTDPGLGALAANGGFGATHAITGASSAAGIAVGSTVATDQRVEGRPGTGGDVGAFEADPLATTLTIDELNVPGNAVSGQAFAAEVVATTTGAGPLAASWTVTDTGGATVATGTGLTPNLTVTTTAADPVGVFTVTVIVTDTATSQSASASSDITVVDPMAMPMTGAAGTVHVTTAADGGPGSLRDAINQANSSGAGTFVILIDAGVNPTLSITASNDDNNVNGDLDIRKSNGAISIVGLDTGSGGNVIDGANLDRVFDIQSGRTVFFTNLTITGGTTTTSDHGAGVRNRGGLGIFKNVDIVGNDASRNTNSNVGGGIYTTSNGLNSGRIYMTGGSVANNTAESNGGGIYMSGTNVGKSLLHLDGTSISGNVASSGGDPNLDDRRGGGFYVTDDGNRVVFNNVTVSDNRTDGDERSDGGGGAITGADQIVEITGGSFVRNRAGLTDERDSDGGGLWIASTRSQIDITGTTFGGELAGGAGAAGIGTARVDGNYSSDDGGGLYIEGRHNTINLVDTKIIGNESRDNGAGFFVANDTETVNITQTTADGTQIRNNVTTTAHGGGFFNIGALNITGSSADAIDISWNEARFTSNNGDIRGGGFWNSDTGVADLTDVHVDGNVANRHGGGFWNSGGGTVTIDSSDASVFRSTVSGNSTIDINDGDGGGFYNTSANSSVTLTDVVVDNNATTDEGGGFYTSSSFSTVSLVRTDITNNVSQDSGGGFYNASDTSEVDLQDVLIDGNHSATEHGGGFRNNGIVTGSDVTISNNYTQHATGDRNLVGGGIYNAGAEATVTLSNVSVSNNSANGRGGGIYNTDGVIDFTNFVIANNSTDQTDVSEREDLGRGGGIWNSDRGTINLSAGTLSKNTSFGHGGAIYSRTDGSEVNATNVTFSGNIAGWDTDDGTGAYQGGRVGGAFWAESGGTSFTFNHVTATENEATSGTPGGGGFRLDSGTTLSLENSIVFGNVINAAGARNAGDIDNNGGSGRLTLVGNNIIGSLSGGVGGNTGGRITIDPNLGALADNGGFSQTHLPSIGGSATDAAVGSTLTEDQRGVARPIGAAADLGAMETPSTLLYVNDEWSAATHGDTVDGDLEFAGEQTAFVGVNAFASVADALAAHSGFTGNIIVNGGDYSGTSADLAAFGNITLQLVEDQTNGESTVTFDALTGDANDAVNTSLHGTGIELELSSGDMAGIISGAGSLRKSTDGTTGAGMGGTLTLSGNNSYDGVTHVDFGRLIAEHNNALGSTVGNTVIAGNGSNAGGQVITRGNNLTIAENMTLNGGNNDGFWGGPLRNEGSNNEWSGVLTLGNSTRISQGGGSSSLRVTGGVTGTSSFVVNNSAGTVTFENNPISIGGGWFEAHGGGITVLNVAGNTWGANTQIRFNGNLRTDVDNALSPNAVVNLGVNTNGGELDLNGTSQVVAGIGTPGTGTNNIFSTAAASLTVNEAGNRTFAGIISGAVSLIKGAAGTTTLTGANTYSGTTAVNGGTLTVNGTHTGAGAYSVGAATLNGSGSTDGVVTSTGGTVDPGVGTTPGTLDTAGLNLDAGSSFNARIDGNSPGDGAGNHDQLVVGNGGAVHVAGTLNLSGSSRARDRRELCADLQ